MVRVAAKSARVVAVLVAKDHLGRERDKLARMVLLAQHVRARPTYLELQIAALDPTKVGHSLPKGLDPCLGGRIGLDIAREHTDAPGLKVERFCGPGISCRSAEKSKKGIRVVG